MSSKRLVALITGLSLAAAPAGAVAKLDYSMNSVSGQYAPPITHQINDVSTPTAATPVPPKVTTTVVRSDTAFSWGDALIGASAALLIAFAGIALVRRRHTTALAG